MPFHKCFTRVSSNMQTVRHLCYMYCKSSACQKIVISTENCIKYFATLWSFYWFLCSHLNKPDPTTKVDSLQKKTKICITLTKGPNQNRKKALYLMKTPLVPCRSYKRYIICRLMAEIRFLYSNYLVCGYIPKYICLTRFGLTPWKS